jgi:thiamine biosynthesis lipoprotein
MKMFRFFLLACCLPLLISCGNKPHAYHEQLLVFGTIVEVKLWGVEEKRARSAVSALAQDFDYMHKTWHAWHPGALARVNQLLASGESFTAAPSIMPLIERSRELSKASGGLFNPAIGKLIALWGFASDDPPSGPPPSPAAIQAILDQHPSMDDIQVEGIHMRCTNPAVKLDFGAFAKGYAVDRAIERLREMGIHDAIVNAGGDLRAIGQHGDRAWRVGIRNPRGEGVLASVEVSGDESVFTSGDYERFFEYEGKRYDHIIDPRTGQPAQGTASVTVFAQQADLADAAATALFVAGPGEWLPIARRMGVSGVLMVDSQGKIYMTPSLKSRIYFEGDPKPPVIMSDPL